MGAQAGVVSEVAGIVLGANVCLPGSVRIVVLNPSESIIRNPLRSHHVEGLVKEPVSISVVVGQGRVHPVYRNASAVRGCSVRRPGS